MKVLSHSSQLFLIRECSVIQLTVGELRIPDIDEIVDVFDSLLAFPLAEPQVAGISRQVSQHLDRVASSALTLDVLTTAVSQLSTAFEPYLKKIGLLKYKGDHLRLYADSQYLGIMDCTLGILLQGTLPKRNKRGPALPAVPIPLVTFSYTPTTAREEVYEKTRIIRNEVHQSRETLLPTLMHQLAVVLSAFLLAVQENLPLIRVHVDPLFSRLSTSVTHLSSRVSYYVDSQSSEWQVHSGNSLDDLLVTEWRDSAGTWRTNNCDTTDLGTIVSITEIARKMPRFWLTGEPGSGKSTSLAKIALDLSEEILQSGEIHIPVPVLISATAISSDVTLEQAIKDELMLSADRLDRLLIHGRLILLLDAFNELSDDGRTQASH